MPLRLRVALHASLLFSTTLFAACASAPVARPTPAPPVVSEGFFAGADGLKLFYRKLGNGPDVAVYLHGGPASLSDGGYDIDPLADGRTLLMFEQRSGARSERVTDPAHRAYPYYVQDVEAFRKRFGLERMAIMGNSWGAMLAVLYASEHPEHVSRLLLLSPGPVAASFRAERDEKTDAARSAPDRARLNEVYTALDTASDAQLPALCREMVTLMFRAYLRDPSRYDRVKARLCPDDAASIRYEFASTGFVWQSLPNYDLRPMLAKLTMPILVVEGADTVVPLSSTREYARQAPDGRLLLIPNTGHAVYVEGGEPFFTAADQFLRGSWPKGAAR